MQVESGCTRRPLEAGGKRPHTRRGDELSPVHAGGAAILANAELVGIVVRKRTTSAAMRFCPVEFTDLDRRSEFGVRHVHPRNAIVLPRMGERTALVTMPIWARPAYSLSPCAGGSVVSD